MTYGYAINGITLQDSTRGWRILRDGTNTQIGVSRNLSKVASPGRPGYTPAPTAPTEQLIIFQVRTTLAGLEPLLALCEAASTVTRTDDATRFANVELASALVSSDSPLDAMQDVTITLSAYEGIWRDVTATDVGPTNVTSPTQVFDILAGVSAPIYDGQIFLRGVFGQFQLVDSRGSWLKSSKNWSIGDSSHGLLWVGKTQQAFLAAEANPFVPISDASSYVDQSGNGGFRMTPQLISGDPGNRRVELTLTTLTQTSTTLRVRAQRAYRMS